MAEPTHPSSRRPTSPLLLLQQTPDLLGTASPDGYFTWLNDRWVEVLGWSFDELFSKPYADFIHPDDLQSTFETAAALSEGVDTVLFTNRYSTSSGEWVWLEWNACVTPGGEFQFVARDITLRLTNEEEQRRAIAKLRMAEEVAQTGHWNVNFASDTVTWSPEVYRIHGRPLSYVPTLAAGIDAYHPDDQARVTDAIEHAVADKTGFDFELRLLRPSGEVRLVHSVGRVLLHDRTNDVIGLFGVFRDITDDERVRRIEELEQFAYVAGHDIKEPVRTIRSFIELIRQSEESPEQDPEHDRYWGFVEEATSRLDRLVTDLAEYTRAGREVEVMPLDLGQVLVGARDNLDARIRELGGQLDIGSFPTVLGEPVLLGAVFQNLLSNALKFAREGHPPRVQVAGEVVGDRVHIHVIDNGIGFESRFKDRIFRPFQRLHTREAFEGTGIGLSLVQRMVRQCGGSVWANSEPGQGATFTVALLPSPVA